MDIRSVVEPFIGPIGSAAIAFPVVAALVAVPFSLHHYRKHGRLHPWRALVGYSFIFYLIAALFLVLLPLPDLPARGADPAAWEARYGALRHPRLDPTGFVRDVLAAGSSRDRVRAVFQAVFNFLLLAPLGAYLSYLFRRRPAVSFLLGLGVSLFFEVCQLTGNFWLYPGPYRLFDVGDLILNSTGALAGASLASALSKRGLLAGLDSLKGPRKPWIGAVRRLTALAVDWAAIGTTLLLALIALRAAGLEDGASSGLAFAVLALFWLVALPSLDGGRGLGKRLALCAVRKRDGARAGAGRILARQAACWGPPIAAFMAAILAPGSGFSVACALVALGLWLPLFSVNAIGAALRAEKAGWIDRKLGTRVRNTWGERGEGEAAILP